MEYYIMKLYEHKKNKSELKFGINRFSTKKRIFAMILLVLLFASLFAMLVLLFIFPEKLSFLCGLIPCVSIMIILLIMDTIERKVKIESYVDDYNKRIDLLYNMLKEHFSIDSKEKTTEVILKFQNYIDTQKAHEKKMNKIVVTILTSFSGLVTTSLANLDSIGIDFTDWLNIVIFILTFVCLTGVLIYTTFYCMKNLNTKREKYESIVDDLEYILLCKY